MREEKTEGISVEKFSTFVLFSVLFNFKNTGVPPLRFQYVVIITYFRSFSTVNARST